MSDDLDLTVLTIDLVNEVCSDLVEGVPLYGDSLGVDGMGRQAILITEMGAPPDKGIGQLYNPARVMIRSYGDTLDQAKTLLVQLNRRLHGIGPVRIGGTPIFRLYVETGPFQMSDEKSAWPCYGATWDLYFALL
jgi:hypothetical protein